MGLFGGANPFGGSGGSPASPLMGGKKQNKQNPIDPDEVDPDPPYMAKGFDKHGRPFYGGGAQGYVKSIFGKIFDPANFDPRPVERKSEIIEQGAVVGGEMLNDAIGWDDWAGKWTGIKAEDIGRSATAMRLTGAQFDESGKMIEQTGAEKAGSLIQTTASIGKFYLGQSVKVGLDILGAVDWTARKAHAANLGIEDLGGSSMLPEATRFDDNTKFGRAANGILRFVPAVAGYNLLRFAFSGKSMAESYKTITDYQKGSAMLYTMAFDEQKKQEYIRRLKAGEDAALLTAELEKPFVELTGSVFGDPTTYLGMGIIGDFGKVNKLSSTLRIPFTQRVITRLPWRTVGRIPGLTEIFHLGLGTNRLKGAGNLFTSVAPELKESLKILENAPDDKAALKMLDDAVQTYGRQMFGGIDRKTGGKIKGFSKSYGFFSPEASAKADIMRKTVGTTWRAVTAGLRDGDDVGELMTAVRTIAGDKKLAGMFDVIQNTEKAKAFTVLSKYGNLFMSEGGMRAVNYMARLDGEIDVAMLIEKHGADTLGLTKDIEGRLYNVIEESFPSVDDMEKAARLSKGVTPEQTKILDEALRLGKELTDEQKEWQALLAGGLKFSERNAELAQQYKNLDGYVKISNQAHRLVAQNKVYKGMQSFFAGVYLGLSPGYAMRNLQSNSVHIWHDLGTAVAGEALEAGLRVAVPNIVGKIPGLKGGDEILDAIKANETARLAKYLGEGVTPTTFGRAIGQIGTKLEGKALGAIATAERIEDAQGIITLRHVVETEMEKMLRYGYMPEVTGLGTDAAARLKQLTLDNFGDARAAVKQLRQEIKTGVSETWRSLEVDPDFKDWLRKANVWEEVDDIRKTAASAPEFIERMKGVLKKLDDAADLARKEPAFVADTNPMGEAAVLIEKGMADAGSAVREEVNQFNALTQLWDDMRIGYSNVAEKLKGRLYNLLPQTMVDDMSGRFSEINTTFNEVVTSNRRIATDFYNGAHKSKKPPAELWDTVKATVLDADGRIVPVSLRQAFPDVDPAQLSQSAFRTMAWKWIKDTQSKFWRQYNQSFIVKQDQILEEMAAAAGKTLDEIKIDAFNGLDNPQLKNLEDLYRQIDEWTNYIAPKTLDPFKDVPAGTKLTQMDMSGVNFPGGKTHLFNAVNKARAEKGMNAYEVMDDVPFEEAVSALKTRLVAKPPMPPRVDSTMPTTARQIYENLKGGGREAIEEFMGATVKKWGETTPISGLDELGEAGLNKFVLHMTKRKVEMNAKAMAIADETRNFILHDYNKTYADKFFGMFMQYHYWPSRTYMRWMERALDTPGTLSAYHKWKQAMDKEHADMPEYYRYQLPIGKLPGLNNSPMFFNLEATLNPLNGLTGVDYNDPYRRADWASATLDDLGKNGFSAFTPIQWLMAANLYRKGEEEAAKRWMGRLIPATQTLKAGINQIEGATGVDITPDIGPLKGVQYGELDPFVNVFGEGMDPSEEKRVGRAMAELIKQGVPREQAFDALLARDGELYDRAVSMAIDERAGGQIASYFLGLGYKNRTQGDVEVELFYNKYYKLLGMRENISPEQYRDTMDQMKEEFPFMDAILLSKRGGDERDGAYSYNVLGRIPPGQSDDLLRSVGIEQEMVDKFYADKGNFETWPKQDKDRFFAAILDLGAMLKMPELAVKEEWNEARDANNAIYASIKGQLGDDIWDKVDAYYDMKDSDPQLAFQFKEAHPEITQALSTRQQLLMNDPAAFEYFGSIDGVEAYYNGRVRAQLKEEFGDLAPLWAEYFDMKLTEPGKAKAFWKSHPELKAYSEMKAELELAANQTFVSIASQLPEREYVSLREDFTAINAEQERLAEQLQNPAQAPTWDEVLQVAGKDLSPSMQLLLQEYWTNGSALSAGAQKQLDYLASRYGSLLGAGDADAFLRMTGLALAKQNQPPDPNQWANPQQPAAQPSLFGGGNPFGQ